MVIHTNREFTLPKNGLQFIVRWFALYEQIANELGTTVNAVRRFIKTYALKKQPRKMELYARIITELTGLEVSPEDLQETDMVVVYRRMLEKMENSEIFISKFSNTGAKKSKSSREESSRSKPTSGKNGRVPRIAGKTTPCSCAPSSGAFSK